MPSDINVLKGFVKTENTILLVLVAVAIGFVAGVVFSAYRSGSQLPGSPAGAAMPLSAEQTQALAGLIQQTQDHPDDVDAWAHLGHLYFDLGQSKEAITAYERALALDDSRPDVWTDLGVMYRRAGNPKQAIVCFDRALSLDAAHEIAMFNKGVVLMHDIEDITQALASWEKLIAINPGFKTPGGQPISEMVSELKKNNPS